ncbi:hypothetical protein [Chitinilyticum litopenaei]|uniref:hypothetical protein n=1 Tax=Chitinilyticum litopenaei TaxID=1121276 RepID=UPI000404C3E4|nr:hypothetical protein [Chitinilyticum litopenaei]
MKFQLYSPKPDHWLWLWLPPEQAAAGFAMATAGLLQVRAALLRVTAHDLPAGAVAEARHWLQEEHCQRIAAQRPVRQSDAALPADSGQCDTLARLSLGRLPDGGFLLELQGEGGLSASAELGTGVMYGLVNLIDGELERMQALQLRGALQ